MHRVILGPAGGDALRARSAAVQENHVGVAFLYAVERGADGVDVARLLAAPTATRVPSGRCASFARCSRARRKSRASMAAEVSFAVWLTCEPQRGRQVEPVASRYAPAEWSRIFSNASRRSPMVRMVSEDAKWRHSSFSLLWYELWCDLYKLLFLLNYWRRGRDSNPRNARAFN